MCGSLTVPTHKVAKSCRPRRAGRADQSEGCFIYGKWRALGIYLEVEVKSRITQLTFPEGVYVRAVFQQPELRGMSSRARSRVTLRVVLMHAGNAAQPPRPRKCAYPIKPRLLEQRSRPTPVYSRPTCCLLQGTPRSAGYWRGTFVALCTVHQACVSFGSKS